MPTIEVDEAVRSGLLRLQEKWGLADLNEVLLRLLSQPPAPPRSMFGVAPKIPSLDRHIREEMWP